MCCTTKEQKQRPDLILWTQPSDLSSSETKAPQFLEFAAGSGAASLAKSVKVLDGSLYFSSQAWKHSGNAKYF